MRILEIIALISIGGYFAYIYIWYCEWQKIKQKQKYNELLRDVIRHIEMSTYREARSYNKTKFSKK